MSPTISIIAAIDKKNGIGKGNKMAWRIREDLIRLSKRTKDGVVILGRNTYESMAGYYDISGKPMPAKEYIVVTRQSDFKSKRDNTYTANSIETALKRAKESGEDEVFIIGGAEIFKQIIGIADKLYLTVVDKDFDCDKFFPDYSDFKKEVSSEKSSDNGINFTFKVLEK